MNRTPRILAGWLGAVLICPAFATAVGADDRSVAGPTDSAFSTPAIAIHPAPAAVSGGETYEYLLTPFHHGNFEDKNEFQKFVDDLGAERWSSVAHFGPAGNLRLFIRRVGGPVEEITYVIEEYRAADADGVTEWVPEWDRLGSEGKYPVWRYEDEGTDYVVSEIRTLEGVRRTLSWDVALIGSAGDVGPADFKRAAEELAGNDYVPTQLGLSGDGSEIYVIGFGERTPGRAISVDLKFGKAKLSTKAKKWKRLTSRTAKEGYHLAEVESFDGTGTNFVLVFARVRINGVAKSRKCVVEPIPLEDLNRIMPPLNARGSAGYETIILTFGGSFTSFQFILCRDR